MYRRFENLENKLCKELNNLEEKYRQGAEMSEGDLKKADMLAHSLKSLMAYENMQQTADYSYDNYNQSGNYMSGNSYGHINGNMNSNINGTSYGHEYDNHMSGGRPPFYPNDRRW